MGRLLEVVKTSAKGLGLSDEVIQHLLDGFVRESGITLEHAEQFAPTILNILYQENLRGEPFAGYDDFDDCVAKNQDKEDPEAYCGSIQHKVEGEVAPGPEERRKGEPLDDDERTKRHHGISDEEWEAMSEEEKQAKRDDTPPKGSGITEIGIKFAKNPKDQKRQLRPDDKPRMMRTERVESFCRVDHLIRTDDKSVWLEKEPYVEGFRWMRGKKYTVPKGLTGHVYAFRTLGVPLTLNGAEWSVEEKRLAARTLIGQPMNLNHGSTFPLGRDLDPESSLIIDAEFEDDRIEGFVYIGDEETNKLYDDGRIIGVSVEYYPRHEDCEGPICKVTGNRFVGMAFVTDDYHMGSPDSTVARVEICLGPIDTKEVAKMAATAEQPKPEPTLEEKISEAVGKALKAVFDPLVLKTIEAKVDSTSKGLDGLKERIEKLEKKGEPAVPPESRKEVVVDLEGDILTVAGPDGKGEVSPDVRVKLDQLRQKRRAYVL